jgi:hypothetical protein
VWRVILLGVLGLNLVCWEFSFFVSKYVNKNCTVTQVMSAVEVGSSNKSRITFIINYITTCNKRINEWMMNQKLNIKKQT